MRSCLQRAQFFFPRKFFILVFIFLSNNLKAQKNKKETPVRFFMPWSHIARAHCIGRGNKPSGKWMGKWSPSHPCRWFKWSRSAVSPDSDRPALGVSSSSSRLVLALNLRPFRWLCKLKQIGRWSRMKLCRSLMFLVWKDFVINYMFQKCLKTVNFTNIFVDFYSIANSIYPSS